MTTSVQTLPASGGLRRSPFDWAFAAVLVALAGWAFHAHGNAMDVYEQGILVFAVPAIIALAWFWGPIRVLLLCSGLASWIVQCLREQLGSGMEISFSLTRPMLILGWAASEKTRPCSWRLA